MKADKRSSILNRKRNNTLNVKILMHYGHCEKNCDQNYSKKRSIYRNTTI